MKKKLHLESVKDLASVAPVSLPAGATNLETHQIPLMADSVLS